MRIPAFLFCLSCLVFLNGCYIHWPPQKVFHAYDPYKKTNTVKLSQSYKGKTDMKNYHKVKTTYYNLDLENDSSKTWAAISLSTSIRDTDFTPELFINADGEISKGEADNYTTKLFLKTSHSSSSSTSTEKEYVEKDKNGADHDDKKEEKVTVTTNSQTTTATDMYQFMSRAFLLEGETLKRIAEVEKLTYRLYLGYEAVDVRIKRKEIKRIRKFAGIACKP